MHTHKLVKVAFDLSGTSWDIPVETLNAEDLGNGTYRLVNVPFYVRGFAYGDIVNAKPDTDGQLVVEGVAKRSGHSTYRVFLKNTTSEELFQSYWSELEKLGCSYERATQSLYALDMAPTVNVAEAYRILEQGESDGIWEFEEGYYHNKT